MVTKLSNEAQLKAHLAGHGNVSRYTSGVMLDGANLTGANLYGADLQRANLSRANLYEANLSRANLYGANLEQANLTGANLTGANLQRAYLEGANLRGANLRGANLTLADLRGANLTGANLRGANLQRAYLEGANLQRAYLTGADLTGADLESITMNWVSHDLIAERLRQAASDDVLLRLGAGYVIMSRDFCFEQLIKHAPNIEHPEHGTVMKWVLKLCISWRKEGDDFPEILQQAYERYVTSVTESE